MRIRLSVILSMLLIGSLRAGAHTTQPAIDARDPRVELRANQAFNRGEYATALPLLNALAVVAKDEPSRLGAIQEKVRVCQKVLDALKNAPAPAVCAVVGVGSAGYSDRPGDSETSIRAP